MRRPGPFPLRPAHCERHLRLKGENLVMTAIQVAAAAAARLLTGLPVPTNTAATVHAARLRAEWAVHSIPCRNQHLRPHLLPQPPTMREGVSLVVGRLGLGEPGLQGLVEQLA
jgi:hypothetical protein